jgi:phosphoenolpyruvate synthase/pyruvate phosphate dikinase
MAITTATKWIYDFAEGSREMRELLGGKGANICEMTRVLGPDLVPAGFTITTEACVGYMRGGRTAPDGLAEAVDERSAGSRRALGGGSATPPTRCWSPCAAARATRCRG